MPEIVTKAMDVTKLNVWKFFGALFMEDKGGVQAVSLHKVLGLTTYIGCMWLWWHDKPVADYMLYTLWGLLGITGATKVVDTFKGAPNGKPTP